MDRDKDKAAKPPLVVPLGSLAYLDPFEVADLLRVSTRYVYEHIEELGGFRLGKYWRFRSDRLPGCVPASRPTGEPDAGTRSK